MGDGTVQNPFTREDVLRLIEENGGRAEGFDLSEKVFVEQIDLSPPAQSSHCQAYCRCGFPLTLAGIDLY